MGLREAGHRSLRAASRPSAGAARGGAAGAARRGQLEAERGRTGPGLGRRARSGPAAERPRRELDGRTALLRPQLDTLTALLGW